MVRGHQNKLFNKGQWQPVTKETDRRLRFSALIGGWGAGTASQRKDMQLTAGAKAGANHADVQEDAADRGARGMGAYHGRLVLGSGGCRLCRARQVVGKSVLF